MDIQGMLNRNVVDDIAPPTYRVRIWSQPIKPGYAWSVEEYEITDVPDVTDALELAEKQASGLQFELFVEWVEMTTNAPGHKQIEKPRITRLFGVSPEED